MRNDIHTKLQIELNKQIDQEPQIVYILSRIRKMLEIGGKEKKYKKLKFFCDWALHAQIDYTDPVKELVDGLIKSDSKAHSDIVNMHSFFEEFEKFLNEYSLTTSIFNSQRSKSEFRDLLQSIYSDTPLIVKTVKKQKITLTDVEHQNPRSFTIKLDDIL